MNVKKSNEQQNQKNLKAKKNNKKNTNILHITCIHMNNEILEIRHNLYVAHSFVRASIYDVRIGKKLSNFLSIHSIHLYYVVLTHRDFFCDADLSAIPFLKFATELPQ